MRETGIQMIYPKKELGGLDSSLWGAEFPVKFRQKSQNTARPNPADNEPSRRS